MAHCESYFNKSPDIFTQSEFCFLTRMENDLQHNFDRLYKKFLSENVHFHVRNLLKKGSLFHQGDFFLSLRSDYKFFNDPVKKELIKEINKISYIRAVEIDRDDNLIIHLKRHILYESILQDVMKFERRYGMRTTNESFLILVHNEVFKNFDALRMAIISNHLISFLATTGATVFVNEFRKDADLAFKEVTTFQCTDACLEHIESLNELIANLVSESKWSSVSEDTNGTIVDLKNFVKAKLLQFGKDTGNIFIAKNAPNFVLNQCAYVSHFQSSHVVSDHIIHVCSHSQKRKIIDSGLLIEMLDLLRSSQIFLTCQTTVFKDEELEVTIGDFISHQKKEIEKAMAHKFSCSTLDKDVRDSYLKVLVDTAVKFFFLRAGTDVPLKIDSTNNQGSSSTNKDGIFVQYNFARLSNILETFESKVKEGYYEKLPPLEEVNFCLLKFEEEWNLLNFVLKFPRLIEEMYFSVKSRQSFPASKMCIMLTKLCSCFSAYYSRIHILGGPQAQLQQVMFARLWLLKGIHQIMCNSFTLLNIQGLKKM